MGARSETPDAAASTTSDKLVVALLSGSVSPFLAAVEVAEEIIFVEGDLAVVSNPERLRSAGGGQSASGAVHATNVYLRYEGDWLMIVHHAS